MPWEFDRNHSTIGFSTRHLGITTVRGRFADADVKVNLDGEDPTGWSLVATVKAASIDTGLERRDEHLRSAAYLDVEAFPTITFETRRVEPRGDGYAVIGDLTMHGVKKEVELAGSFNGAAVDREVQKRGFSAQGAIDRFAFGVGEPKGTWSVGPEIRLELEMETALKDS